MDYSMDLGLVASPWRCVGKSGEKSKGRKLHLYMHPVAYTWLRHLWSSGFAILLCLCPATVFLRGIKMQISHNVFSSLHCIHFSPC